MTSPRIEAAKKGLKRYEGKPCKTCGNTTRYTVSTGCVQCIAKSAKKNADAMKALIEQAKAGE